VVCWNLWKIHNKMAIENKLIKNPSDAIFKIILSTALQTVTAGGDGNGTSSQHHSSTALAQMFPVNGSATGLKISAPFKISEVAKFASFYQILVTLTEFPLFSTTF
jgi:hypothetical protein